MWKALTKVRHCQVSLGMYLQCIPVGRVADSCTINRLYLTTVFFRDAAHKLFHNILASDSDHPCLTLIANAIAHGRPVQNSSGRFRTKFPCSRIVLPYHPSLRDVPRCLYGLRHRFRLLNLQDLVPQVAWKLGDVNLARLCIRDSLVKINRIGQGGS